MEEVKGDIRELTEDGFLKSVPGSSLTRIGITLGDLNKALKDSKGNLKDQKGEFQENTEQKEPSDFDFAYRPLIVLYPPLSKIQADDLSYEVFLELINKTDYNLRVLVESLEKKLRGDKMGYQIEQARIRGKFR